MSHFIERSAKLERIDTGDYTSAEYALFLREIRFINRYLGDARALRRSLIRKISDETVREFSVLDVACGSGELLRHIAHHARRTGGSARLTGIDNHELSFARVSEHDDVEFMLGDAFSLPFADGSFDFVISSLFLHHLPDEQIPHALAEMSRVARRSIFIIDLHRHRAAYALYKLFCFAFRISPLVTEDGSLSILKGFKPKEMLEFGSYAGLNRVSVRRSAPFRLILEAECDN